VYLLAPHLPSSAHLFAAIYLPITISQSPQSAQEKIENPVMFKAAGWRAAPGFRKSALCPVSVARFADPKMIRTLGDENSHDGTLNFYPIFFSKESSLIILDFSPPWPPLSPSWRLYEPEAGQAYGLEAGS
jgi:hypothetical protein